MFQLQMMASNMIAAQHRCEGLLKFILPDNMVIVYLEVMTLTGVHVYKRDKDCIEKWFFPWNNENTPPPEFLRKVREIQGKRNKVFLESLLNQELIPNFRPKSPCKCSNFPKLVDKHRALLASKHKAINSDSSLDRHVTPSDNIPVMVGKVKTQKWPRKQHRKINVRSNWSELDDGKDNQARGNPAVIDITSDQETDMDQQPSISAPLRRPNTWPKVLNCGRGRGKFPLANCTSMTKGHWSRLNSGCDIPQAPSFSKQLQSRTNCRKKPHSSCTKR